MSAARALVFGGFAYWAYQKGYVQPVLAALFPQAHATPSTGPVVDPISFPGVTAPVVTSPPTRRNLGSVQNEYDLLNDNIDVVQQWVRANMVWTACLMEQESGGRVNIRGPRTRYGYAYGSMQVLLSTARQIFNTGYTQFQPTEAVLRSEKGGIYFGTAYLQMLSERGRDLRWMAMAYHGGPGGEGTANWGPRTNAYANNIMSKYNRLQGEIT